MSEPTETPSRRPILLIAVALAVVAGAIFLLASVYSAPPISSADASATAEARQFATAEVERQATAVAVRRTSTAIARASATAQVIARATRDVQSTATTEAVIVSTSTAAAIATAIAPATQTAEARTYEDRRAEAELATSRLDAQATQVFGPSAGTLDHRTDGTVTCAESGIALHDFIASARFYNPYSPAQHRWDYGIAFSNEGEDTSYVLTIRSTGEYALKLTGPSFYIEVNNATDLIDLSRPGDNLVKLYKEDNTVYIYFNGVYADTLDLRNMDLNQTNARNHSPMACANLDEGSALENATTRYEAFTVWRIP